MTKTLEEELTRAKELLQEMADAIKDDPDYVRKGGPDNYERHYYVRKGGPDYDDLHYRVVSFLNRRTYPLTSKG